MTTEEAIHFAKCLKNNYTIDFNDMADFCDMAIEALSTERAGEWVDFDLKPAPNGVTVEKCGNCGEWSTQMGKNFCPNCGADMRGEQDG